uniref:Ig-like domain-containing protein n=1 Tax=Pseudonaja textilis TaxID=8673 RepID=A0A670YYS9_PSETE
EGRGGGGRGRRGLWGPWGSLSLLHSCRYFMNELGNTISAKRERGLITFHRWVMKLPVKFAKKLEPIKAELGKALSLSCELSQPEGTVVWRKDGTILKASKHYLMQEIGAKRVLVISSLRAEDKGEYSCETRNDQCTIQVTPTGTF